MELSYSRDEPTHPPNSVFEWAFFESHSQLAIVFSAELGGLQKNKSNSWKQLALP